MSRRLRVALALALVVAGFALGIVATPLSGGTILAAALIASGAWWLIGLTAPATRLTLEDACELMDAQQRRAADR